MLPAAFVFCFGGKFVFGGRAFACTAGFFPRFGGSSVARPGGRDDASIVLLIILRVMAAGSSYTTHCSKIPQQVPQNQSSPVMNRFCFQLGLTRHSTARPIPAPEHSPAKKLPKVIAPPIYS